MRSRYEVRHFSIAVIDSNGCLRTNPKELFTTGKAGKGFSTRISFKKKKEKAAAPVRMRGCTCTCASAYVPEYTDDALS